MSAGLQHDADLLWTGSELIVAWTDLLDVKYRRFDSSLTPLAAEADLLALSAIESSVTLAHVLPAGWAAAVRANDAGLEMIHVVLGGLSWFTAPALPAPAGDRPALAALDADHLLLFYSVGTDPLDAGSANVGRLRTAVLSRSSPGSVSSSAFRSTLDPYASDATLRQRRPSAVRVGERIYIGWETQKPSADGLDTEVFVARVGLDASGASSIVLYEELALPNRPRARSAQNPRLSASPLWPSGALLSAWEDAPPSSSHDRAVELRVDLRPSPFVLLDPVAVTTNEYR